jgi:hypothetical protein
MYYMYVSGNEHHRDMTTLLDERQHVVFIVTHI